MHHSRAEHDQNVREGRHPQPPGERVSDLVLWTAVLLGPVAWAASLLVGYPLTSPECTTGAVVALVLVTLAGTAAAVVGFLIARRARGALAVPVDVSGREDSSIDDDRPHARTAPPTAGPASAIGRQRLMAHGGMILSALMVAIMVGHGVSLLVLGPCG